MRTPRLPVVDRNDAPADLNGFVRFAERRNLVCARVPSYFERSLPSCLLLCLLQQHELLQLKFCQQFRAHSDIFTARYVKAELCVTCLLQPVTRQRSV